jgi:hypothetical protein
MSLSGLTGISFTFHQFHALPFVCLCLQAMTEYGQARFSFVSAEVQALYTGSPNKYIEKSMEKVTLPLF